MSKTITTNSEAETFQAGKELAAKLRGGEIIGLYGDLGAGKTVFTRGVCAGLGYEKKVQSPTFVLLKTYPLENKQIKQICHIDAYRINSFKDLEAIGAEDYLENKNTVTLIEWAGKLDLEEYSNLIKVKLEILEEEKRRLKLFGKNINQPDTKKRTQSSHPLS